MPRTLPARADGGSFAPLSSGAEASLFELIPGTLPKLTHVREMGRAAGELSAALAAVQLSVASPTAPYYELYKVHHAVSRDKFYAEVAKPSFDGCREAIAYLTAQIGAMEASLAKFHDLKLPRQLIHVRAAQRLRYAARDRSRMRRCLYHEQALLLPCRPPHIVPLAHRSRPPSYRRALLLTPYTPNTPPTHRLHQKPTRRQGDFHYDNCLVDKGAVSGLLDFEFCAMDWRAMELAICLSARWRPRPTPPLLPRVPSLLPPFPLSPPPFFLSLPFVYRWQPPSAAAAAAAPLHHGCCGLSAHHHRCPPESPRAEVRRRAGALPLLPGIHRRICGARRAERRAR